MTISVEEADKIIVAMRQYSSALDAIMPLIDDEDAEVEEEERVQLVQDWITAHQELDSVMITRGII